MTSGDEQDESSALGVPSSLSKRVAKLAWLADADRDQADERMARLEGDRVLAAARGEERLDATGRLRRDRGIGPGADWPADDPGKLFAAGRGFTPGAASSA